MTNVSIFRLPTNGRSVSYLALAGDKQSFGRTAGEALDALTVQLAQEQRGTLVVLQNRQPDEFFSAEEQQRLSELMAAWRAARDEAASLPTGKQSELEALVEAELFASAERTKTALQQGDEPTLPAGRAACAVSVRVLPCTGIRLQLCV